MKCAQNNQQFNFFTNNSDVSISPMVISSFLTALSRFGLIPTFGQEFNAFTGERKQVLIMTNPEQTFKIEFPSHAVLISAADLSLNEFGVKVKDILGVLESLLPGKKANRLALISTSLFIGETEEYQSIYDKLFTYKDVTPFEWDNRIAQKINSPAVDVSLNHVSTIRRCFVSSVLINSGREVDSIMFEYDTNTTSEATDFRYDWKKAIEIVEVLIEHNSEQAKKTERYTK